MPEMQAAHRLTLGSSLSCIRLRLWDEDAKALVGWRELRPYLAAERAAKAAGTGAASEAALG